MNRWKLSSILLVILMGQCSAFDGDPSSSNKEASTEEQTRALKKKALTEQIREYADDLKDARDPHQRILLQQSINNLKRQLLNP